MSSRRLQILQIFNRYLQYGGEEGSITRIGDALQQIHDIDYFFYSTSQLKGEAWWDSLKIPWKSYRNAEVELGLMRLQQHGKYDVWQIHNVFPAMSPVVYELALKWNMPIIHYLHNYRFSCVNGFSSITVSRASDACREIFGLPFKPPAGETVTPKAAGWG